MHTARNKQQEKKTEEKTNNNVGLVLPEKYVSVGFCLILVSSPIQHSVESRKVKKKWAVLGSQDQSVANIRHNQYGFGVCNPDECDETLRFTCVHPIDGALCVGNAVFNCWMWLASCQR